MNELFWMWAAGTLVLVLLLAWIVAAVRRSRQQAEARRAAEAAALELAQHEARRLATERAAAAEAQAAQAAQRAAAERAAQQAAAQAAQAEADEEAETRAAVAAAYREGERLAAEQAAELAVARAAEQARRAAELAEAQAAERRAAAARLAALEAELLARRESQAAAPAPEPAPPPPASPAPRAAEDTLVMVADDSKVVRVKTSRLLALHGYRVVLAEDGARAAELIEQEVPAVLITDVEMPGLDGFALTRHVRSHPRAAHIPIVMITAADDRLKSAAAEAGVTLVLGKPYEEAALLACIAQAMAATA